MIDLRGMPLTVVEASVRALQESPGLTGWLAAFPGADMDLLTELAPVVAASIEAWIAYRVLADECEAAGGGGHTYQVLADGDGPAGVVCGHCSSTWAVVPSLTVPSPDGHDHERPSGNGDTDDEGRPEADAPALPPAPPVEPEALVVVRNVDVTRPAAAAAPDAGEGVAAACGQCGEPIDTADGDLMRANTAIQPIIKKQLCGGCMLTCERNPEHVIADYNQAVLSAMRWQERTCLPCMQERKNGKGTDGQG